MGKKRNRLEVIRDILQVIRNKNGKIKPTHILYKSNLSYQMMDEYLNELMGKEFIKQVKTQKGKTYVITEKGLNYLNKFSLIKDFFKFEMSFARKTLLVWSDLVVISPSLNKYFAIPPNLKFFIHTFQCSNCHILKTLKISLNFAICQVGLTNSFKRV